MKRFLCAVGVCLLGHGAAHAACTDDPRLAALNAFVDQLDAGQAVEPLALTPRTFLDKNPYLRRALGDSIVEQDPETCAPQELVAGMAVTRTPVPFSTLFNRFLEAVIAQDGMGQRVILASYLAEPLPVEQVLGLGGRTGFPPPLAGALAAVAALEVIDGGHISDETKIESLHQYLAHRATGAGPQTEGAAPARAPLFD